MQDFEKLGVFYLGKEVDPANGQLAEAPLLYDAKDLTTHGVILGMTGSGKTGLALSLLEEAAIDGIPAICIDPKGDLGNLLLAFPNLQPTDFRPWIDEGEASRKGMTPDEFAIRTAESWQKGLAEWGQDAARIQKYRDAVDMAVYTPGNSAGRPLQILRSFTAPPPAVASDASALRERIMSAVSGLLGLLGINADPIQSREHILISNILDRAWREGRSLDIAAIINDIQKPPFERIGVFDLESFYPAKDRFGLAMALNNLLASPGFSAWMDGEPMDIQRLLYTTEGKPRLSVIYIAHLSDAERMFFVTLLLNEVLAWVRSQSGTSSLRALLYMDEIYGYFPPTANPPSKTPMLTLLKQARAFGLGVVLSTQNPVDLDYKGLSNCGTWMIGRLQTERDKARVIEGLEGASAGATFDRAKTEQMLASLGNRVFLMRNVHDDSVLFQTRWALSYLRGPLTLPQITKLMGSAKPSASAASPAAPIASAPPAPAPQAASTVSTRPTLPAGVPEVFLRPKMPGDGISYRPQLFGVSKLHFVDAKSGVDTWMTYTHVAPLSDDGAEALWAESQQYGDIKADLDKVPQGGASFAEAPVGLQRAQNFKAWTSALEDHLYQNVQLQLLSAPSLKLTAQPGETEGDFKARVAQVLRERRDLDVEKLRKKYAPKAQTLQDQLRRAQERVEREKAQASQQKMTAAINMGATILGALLGGGRRLASATNVSRTASTLKSAGKIGKESQDIDRANESVEVIQQRVQALNEQVEQEVATVSATLDPESVEVLSASVRPRKSDISIGSVGVVWLPWRAGADGIPQPA